MARAVYGDPVFVVLDEPDANLDGEGEAALLKTLQALAQRKATMVVVTHTPRLLRGVEQVVVLQEGQVWTAARGSRSCNGWCARPPRSAGEPDE